MQCAMASSVVLNQPTGQPGNQPVKYNKDGEQIIFEGTISKGGRCLICCDVYSNIAAGSGELLFVCLGICFGIKASREWELNLSSTSISYCMPRGTGCQTMYFNWNIPLSDIESIHKSEVSEDIIIVMSERKVKEITGENGKEITLSRCSNSQEFVDAVKKTAGLQ